MLTSLRCFYLFAMLLCSAFVNAEIIQRGNASWAIEALPDWVRDEEIATTPVTPSQGIRLLQSDTQINWLQQQPAQYRRHATQVVASSGIDNAAKYEIEFEPSYQQLAIHRLRVKRNGQWSDRLQAKPVELLRRETNLESSQYDGRITASINLPDVRTGDIVEMAWSIRGVNPIFGEQRSARLYLVAGGAYASRLLRLLAPAGAPLYYKMVGPQTAAVEDSSRTGVRELIVRPQQKEAFIFEDMAPSQITQASFLHVTTVKDWAQVIQWGRSLFAIEQPSSPDFKAKVAELQAIRDPAERVMAALNFVQEDVRYFGVEININSHKPYTPDQVIGQRYGDCKDKTQLLYWLLRASGIKTSAPVLASMFGGVTLNDALPSADLFDHVILRLQLDGKTWWLDPTVTGQGDSLATLGGYRYGQVLPLDENSRGLVLATPTRATGGRSIFAERVVVKDMSGAAQLYLDNEYHLEEAERMRRRVAETGLEELQRQWQEEARKRYPEADTVTSLLLEDNRKTNVLRLREHYAVKEVFKVSEGSLRFSIDGSVMSNYLPRPQVNTRRYAIQLPQMEEVQYSYELQGDYIATNLAAPSTTTTSKQEDPHLRLTVDKSIKPGSVRVNMKLQLFADEVSPAAAPRYLKTTQAAMTGSSLAYTYGMATDSTVGYAELEQQLRKQHAAVQPESWREILITSSVQVARLQHILDHLRPSDTVRAVVASRLAWQLVNIGEPEKALQLTSQFERMPEHSQDPEAWQAMSHLLQGQAAAGWRNFQSFQQNRTDSMSWYDNCTGVLLALLQGKYDDARTLLVGFPVTTTQRTEATRWMALVLRLQYGVNAASSHWPSDWQSADGDPTTTQLMTRSDAQLRKVAELYNELAPGNATRLWFALALQARREGQNSLAGEYLQQIIQLKVGVLHDHNIARTWKNRWSKERGAPREGF